MCVIWLTPVTLCSASVRRDGKAMLVMSLTVPQIVATLCRVGVKSETRAVSATLAGKVGHLYVHQQMKHNDIPRTW